MKIFFNGDSHTCGSEVHDPLINTYSYQLARKLKATQVINPSVGGASNDRILRTTEKYLAECERNNSYPDLIVIAWSEFTRQDWYLDGAYRSLTPDDGIPIVVYLPELEIDTDDEKKKARFKYAKTLFQPDIVKDYIARYFQERIYNLHCELNHKKIPHLFFNAHISFNFFCNMQELYQHDWQDRFWKPYETYGCFREYFTSIGYEETPYHHHGIAAHTKFADMLYDYIMEHNLLSCPSDNY